MDLSVKFFIYFFQFIISNYIQIFIGLISQFVEVKMEQELYHLIINFFIPILSNIFTIVYISSAVYSILHEKITLKRIEKDEFVENISNKEKNTCESFLLYFKSLNI